MQTIVKELFALNIYFKRYGIQMILGIICVIVSNIAGVFVPVFVRQGLDDGLLHSMISNGTSMGFSNPALKVALGFGVFILLAAAFKGVFMYLMRKYIVVVSRHVEYDLKNDIYEHYQKLDTAFYRKNFTGDMMARIGEDVSNVRMYVGPAVMYFTNIIFVFITVIFQMFLVNPMMTFWVLLPLPVLSISIYKVSTIINLRTIDIQAQLSRLTTFVQETFSGIRVIKSFGAENNFTGAFEKEGKEYRKRTMRLAFVNSLFFPLMMLLIGLSNLLVLYLGGIESAKGNFTAGNIAEFVIYLNMLIWPVASLGWTTALVQKAAASQKRINEFLDVIPEQNSDKGMEFMLNKTIEFNHVNFTYPGSKVKALDDVSFIVKKGTVLGITGRTGSGKSTLAQLLMRLYEPDSGKILADGVPLSEYSVPSFRQKVGYVPQDVFLFSETIHDNIAFGKEMGETSENDSLDAALKAGLKTDIDNMPLGLNTVLGERGVTLSGGQKQRVSIARALVRDASLYILDDCLSAVDASTEQEIIRSFSDSMKDKTAIIISHRAASLSFADQIIVLSHGRIVEQGTRDALMKLGGHYAKLYAKQSLESELTS